MKVTIRQIIHPARALVFDFDGTLVDSNPIKWRAFESVFKGIGQRRKEILAYLKGNSHTTREEKFRHVYEEILRVPYTPKIEATLLNRFEAKTTRQIVEAPTVPGALAFLRRARKRYVTALLSSTPHPILTDILKRRGWLDYFRLVRGAPVDKGQWLRAYVKARNLRAEQVVFFGDSSEDLKAAGQARCPFVAVANRNLKSQARTFISDFTDFEHGP